MVESSSIRFGQLAYVVAFSGGGAKDITSRSVMPGCSISCCYQVLTNKLSVMPSCTIHCYTCSTWVAIQHAWDLSNASQVHYTARLAICCPSRRESIPWLLGTESIGSQGLFLSFLHEALTCKRAECLIERQYPLVGMWVISAKHPRQGVQTDSGGKKQWSQWDMLNWRPPAHTWPLLLPQTLAQTLMESLTEKSPEMPLSFQSLLAYSPIRLHQSDHLLSGRLKRSLSVVRHFMLNITDRWNLQYYNQKQRDSSTTHPAMQICHSADPSPCRIGWQDFGQANQHENLWSWLPIRDVVLISICTLSLQWFW